MEAIAEIEKMQSSLEEIRNTDPQSLAQIEPGEEWRQGDLRIIRLQDDFDFPAHCNPCNGNIQLVPGSTQGSRHCLDSLSGVTMYRLNEQTALDGPVIHTTSERSVLHPTHGDCIEIPPGNYAFVGQRAFAEELKRALD